MILLPRIWTHQTGSPLAKIASSLLHWPWQREAWARDGLRQSFVVSSRSCASRGGFWPSLFVWTKGFGYITAGLVRAWASALRPTMYKRNSCPA